MKTYIATYKNGQMAWIKAKSLLFAVQEAEKLEEEPKEYEPKPEKCFTHVEVPYFGQKKVATKEYLNWKQGKERVDSFNNSRRFGLVKVQEFMPKDD